MGLETNLKKEVRMTRIREALLTTLKVGGYMTLAVMAPNVAGVLGKHLTKAHQKNMRSSLRRLRDKGMITWQDGRAQITPKGQQYLNQYDFAIERPFRWDKKWRIVIFDIPERRKVFRQTLRDTLRRIGFYQLQRSVWIYPFDCEELITLLKTNYRVGYEVSYIIADKVDNDKKLRNYFKV